MTTGRPTEYSSEVIDKANEYLNTYAERGEKIPSIEGLALYIDIARSTVYKWKEEKNKEGFSDIIEKIMAEQGKTLINKGLSGDFNSTITKVLMSKHGYREGIEHMGDEGGPIKHDVTGMLTKVYGDDSTGEVSDNS